MRWWRNPWSAHPSFAQGYYDRDNAAYVAWDRVTRDPAELERYLDEWVHGLPDRAAYLARLGEETRARLKPGPRLAGPGRLRGLPVTTPARTPTRAEIMVLAASREVRDRDAVFVGVGLPNLAVQLALRLHAPGCHLIYESGVFGARPVRLPISIGDPCLVSGAAQVLPMAETFLYFLQGGRTDLGFLGAAPDRPLRQPEHHRGRAELPPAEGAASGCGRRPGHRPERSPHGSHRPPGPPEIRRETRLPHHRGLGRRGPKPRKKWERPAAALLG